MNLWYKRIVIALTGIVVLGLVSYGPLATTGTAHAQVIGEASAYGISTDLQLLPVLGGQGIDLDVPPTPAVSGKAPPPFTKFDSVASSNTLLTSAPLLSTGTLSVIALSDVTAGQLKRDTSVGQAVVANPKLNIAGLLSLNIQSIDSTAIVSGRCGTSLAASGITNIVGATPGGTLGLGLNIAPQPAPNTQILNLLGIRIIANEQLQSGDGVKSKKITVNALHISIQNSLLSTLGVLSGDIIIGQSQASLTCAVADVVVSKSATPASVAPNTNLTYTVTVENKGPDLAPEVFVADLMPFGVDIISINPTKGTCVSAPRAGDQAIVCTIGDMPSKTTQKVTIVVKVRATTNIASAAALAADPIIMNNITRIDTPLK